MSADEENSPHWGPVQSEQAENQLERGLEFLNHEKWDDAFACFLRGIQLSPDHSELQLMLGVLHYNGQGVSRNYEEAAKWYRNAADQDNVHAQFNLGLLYDRGEGVAQDYVQAAAWYRRAADKGDANAQYLLGSLYNRGQGVAQDFEQAAELYRKSGDQGNADAQCLAPRLHKLISHFHIQLDDAGSISICRCRRLRSSKTPLSTQVRLSGPHLETYWRHKLVLVDTLLLAVTEPD